MFYFNDDTKKNAIKGVNDVEYGIKYFYRELFNKALTMFEYKNLPSELPQHEIERYLLEYGFCAIANIDNKFYALTGSLSGVTPYQDIYTTFTHGTPTLSSGALKIDKECIIAKNTKLMHPLRHTILRYATKLSQLDASLDIATVNSRMMGLPLVKNNKDIDTWDKVYENLRKGEYKAMLSEEMDFFDNIKFLPLQSNGTFKSLIELVTVRNNEMRNFYKEIGVNMSKDKTQAILSDEVSSDEQLLGVNINVMLDARREWVRELNKLFDLNVTVNISEPFKIASTQHDNVESEANNDETMEDII